MHIFSFTLTVSTTVQFLQLHLSCTSGTLVSLQVGHLFLHDEATAKIFVRLALMWLECKMSLTEVVAAEDTATGEVM